MRLEKTTTRRDEEGEETVARAWRRYLVDSTSASKYNDNSCLDCKLSLDFGPYSLELLILSLISDYGYC
ncbi:hypothetical protein L1887_14388 [Cichorium endivia]|nr:hypothetical protein L1887_14388 [Cichorium endivia]